MIGISALIYASISVLQAVICETQLHFDIVCRGRSAYYSPEDIKLSRQTEKAPIVY